MYNLRLFFTIHKEQYRLACIVTLDEPARVIKDFKEED